MTLRHIVVGAYLAATDVHQGTAKDVALGTKVHSLFFFFAHPAFAVPVVITTATAEDIAQDMTVVQGNRGFTSLVNDALRVVLHRATSDGTNFAATEKAAANSSAVHLDIGYIRITIGHVATAEDIATLVQKIVTSGYVVEFGVVFSCAGIVSVADVAVVDLHEGRAEDATTFTTTIDVTGDGRNAVDVACAIPFTDNNMGLARDVTRIGVTDSTNMMPYGATPSTAIDVTHGTALDVGRGGCNKTFIIICAMIDARIPHVFHRTARATSIDVLGHLTAEQGDVCVTSHRGIGTKTSTITIISHEGSFIDNNIGIVLVNNQWYVCCCQVSPIAVIHFSHSY